MKAGDLVQVRIDPGFSDSGAIALVQWVNEQYPATCGLLINNELRVYDLRTVEVICEGR